MRIFIKLRESIAAPFFVIAHPCRMALPLLCAAIVLGACSDSETTTLSEKPPISVIPYQTLLPESVVRTRLVLPLDNLSQRLEADLPQVLFEEPGKIHKKCVRIFGKKLCEDFEVSGWVQCNGPLQLQALSNGYLRIALPLRYQVKVRADGNIVRELLKGVDVKPAAFTVVVDLKPDLNRDWTLQLSSHTQIHWNEKPVIEVLGIDISITGQIDKPLNKALQIAAAKFEQKLASDDRIRERASDFWERIQQPRALKGKLPLWVRAQPQRLSLSNLAIRNNALQLDLSLRTMLQTASEQSGLSTVTTALPELERLAPQASALNINLPLTVSYEHLAELLHKQLQKRPIKLKQGGTTLTVNEVSLYPNNDRLVMAAKVSLGSFGNMMSSDGEIYISGVPVIDAAPQQLKLDNVAFSRKLDSTFWSAATSLLHKQLLEQLQSSLIYDFSEQYADLEDSVNRKLLTGNGDGFSYQGQLERIDIANPQLDLEQLQIMFMLKARVDQVELY